MTSSTDWRQCPPRSGPRPSGRSPVPIPQSVSQCEHCHTPFFIGELGPGSRIEVMCKRHGCKGYKVPVPILVPKCDNSSAHDELRDNNRQQAPPNGGVAEVNHG
jgi:hypothetical protein